jgi:hypothetical protein
VGKMKRQNQHYDACQMSKRWRENNKPQADLRRVFVHLIHLQLFFGSKGSRKANTVLTAAFFRPLCECSTLHILDSLQITGQLFSAPCSYRLPLVLGKFVNGRVFEQWWVISGTHFSFTFSLRDLWKTD